MLTPRGISAVPACSVSLGTIDNEESRICVVKDVDAEINGLSHGESRNIVMNYGESGICGVNHEESKISVLSHGESGKNVKCNGESGICAFTDEEVGRSVVNRQELRISVVNHGFGNNVSTDV